MYYEYIWVQFHLLASRDRLRWFGGSEFCMVTGAWFCGHGKQYKTAALGGVCFCLFFCVHPV